MRRSIQDLAISIDPNIKIEPEVEDVRPPLLAPNSPPFPSSLMGPYLLRSLYSFF